MAFKQDPVMRFWRMTDRRGPDECWEWKGGISGAGYGNFFPSHRKQFSAHRFSYELHHGPLGKLFCLHKCDNRKCVNPNHLFAGTQAENIKDRDAKGHAMYGLKNHKARLSPQKLILARLYRANGWTYKKIASHFNVGTKGMHSALTGATWRSVE